MDESSEFVVEEVEAILRQAIHQCFTDAVKPPPGAPPDEDGPPKEVMYNPKKVNEWTNTIVGKALKDLLDLNKPFKYIISCIIMQKMGQDLIARLQCIGIRQRMDFAKCRGKMAPCIV